MTRAMFGLRRHRHHQPVHAGFVENYPFTVLLDNGWNVLHTSNAHIRRRRIGPVHTVAFVHPDGHHAIFDINSRGHMSDHATYTLTHREPRAAIFLAYNADAAAAMTATIARRSVDELAALPAVRRLR